MKIDPRYKYGWIVLGGEGMTMGMRAFLTNEVSEWIPSMKGKVSVMTTDQFISADIKIKF